MFIEYAAPQHGGKPLLRLVSLIFPCSCRIMSPWCRPCNNQEDSCPDRVLRVSALATRAVYRVEASKMLYMRRARFQMRMFETDGQESETRERHITSSRVWEPRAFRRWCPDGRSPGLRSRPREVFHLLRQRHLRVLYLCRRRLLPLLQELSLSTA